MKFLKKFQNRTTRCQEIAKGKNPISNKILALLSLLKQMWLVVKVDGDRFKLDLTRWKVMYLPRLK